MFRRAGRTLVFAVVLVTALGSWTGTADAHAFLVRVDPQQGARLASPPQSVAVEFSEVVEEASARMSVTSPDGSDEQPLAPRAEAGGRILRAPLEVGSGIYVVRWRIVAEDGHENSGEFAFAVGEVSGALPPSRSSASRPSLIRSASSWAFFLGLALVAGSLATASVVDGDVSGRSHPRRFGLLVASTAAMATLLTSRLGVGGAIGPPRQLLLLGVASALLAGGLLAWRHPRAVAAAVVGAAAAWAARGQNAVANGLLGGIADVLHLAAGATWVGALALLVNDVRSRGGRAEPAVGSRVARYARLAAVLVAVLAGAGVLSAALLLPSASDLWQSGYGRLLLAKTSLLAVALGAAFGARRWGRRQLGSGLLRRLASAELVVVVAVLGISGVLVTFAPPAPPVAAATLLGPEPFEGEVVRDAGPAGILTVAVTAGPDRILIEVISPGGPDSDTTATIRGTAPDGTGFALYPRSCGPGCFTQRWRPLRGVSEVEVTATTPGWQGGSFTADVDWPPPADEPELLARVLTAMRAVPTVEMTERSSSGPDSVVTPSTFRLSGAELVDAQPYASGAADDIRPLATGSGFRLYLPGERIWATAWLDPEGRLARERIVSPGHLIERTYRYPDG